MAASPLFAVGSPSKGASESMKKGTGMSATVRAKWLPSSLMVFSLLLAHAAAAQSTIQ